MMERRLTGLHNLPGSPWSFPIAWRFLAGLILVCAVLTGHAEGAGTFPSAFVVSDVPVDGSGPTGVAAREAARVQGTKVAFRRLLERLTNKADWQRLPTLDGQTVLDYVQDVEVTNERSSANRYLANYTFRFSPNGVRKLLRGANLAFSELASKPVIVVPVLRGESAAKLFDEAGPWRAAWLAAHGGDGLVPFQILQADQAQNAGFDQAAAQGSRPEQIAALSARYNGADIVIAQATLQNDGGDVGLEIGLTRYSGEGASDMVGTRIAGAKADGAFYQMAVQASVRELEEQWKKQLAASTGGGTLAATGTASDQDTVLKVVVPIAGPGDWVAVRDRLARLSFLRDRAPDLMTRSAVTVRLRFKGDLGAGRLALAQQDLVLAEGGPGGTPLLRLRQPTDSLPAPVPVGQ